MLLDNPLPRDDGSSPSMEGHMFVKSILQKSVPLGNDEGFPLQIHFPFPQFSTWSFDMIQLIEQFEKTTTSLQELLLCYVK